MDGYLAPTANGSYSHAEGCGTLTTSMYAHAEGKYTEARGVASHAEGNGQWANYSGRYGRARGDCSHVEGHCTIADSLSQHVQGEYNIADTEGSAAIRGKYAHIVGNGTSNNARSNAHTLDWQGNGWFAGSVFTGGSGQDDATAKKLATEGYVDEVVAGALPLTGGRVTGDVIFDGNITVETGYSLPHVVDLQYRPDLVTIAGFTHLRGIAPPQEADFAVNKEYVDNLVGNINSLLDAINGEVL